MKTTYINSIHAIPNSFNSSRPVVGQLRELRYALPVI